jgi:hypothetical protein
VIIGDEYYGGGYIPDGKGECEVDNEVSPGEPKDDEDDPERE